jgi:hypothetical protein
VGGGRHGGFRPQYGQCNLCFEFGHLRRTCPKNTGGGAQGSSMPVTPGPPAPGV